MAGSIAMRCLTVLWLASGSFAACAAQVYTPPPPPLTTLPPCPVPRDAKEAKKMAKRKDCDPTNRPAPPVAAIPVASDPNSPTKKFPFPGDPVAGAGGAPTSAAKAFPFPGEAPVANPSPASAPSSAAKFPFPGEKTDSTGDSAAPGGSHDGSAVETPAAKAFPYPGDLAGPASATPGGSTPASTSSSSSTSSDGAASDATSSDGTSKDGTPIARAASSDDDDDGQPQLTDKGSEGKRNKKTVKPQTDSARVDEDLSVAKYYGQSGNAMGAYLRAKDAVKTEPDYPEARFIMGEAARRLDKNEEAKSEFSEYLKLAPDGEHAKAAEKALSELR